MPDHHARSPDDRRPPVIALRGDPGAADVGRTCLAVDLLLAGRAAGVLICDVTQLGRPDARALDLLARIALTARRHGCRLALRGAPAPLTSLVALAGLGAVLPCADLGVEAER